MNRNNESNQRIESMNRNNESNQRIEPKNRNNESTKNKNLPLLGFFTGIICLFYKLLRGQPRGHGNAREGGGGHLVRTSPSTTTILSGKTNGF